MRTQEEILTRMAERRKYDLYGFEVDEYFLGLDYEHAKPYTEETSCEWGTPMTKEKLLEHAKNYMPFAFGKAHDKRGISANRAVMHYIAWLWLLEEDKLCKKVENELETNYHDYGIPILNMICDHFGWEKC